MPVDPGVEFQVYVRGKSKIVAAAVNVYIALIHSNTQQPWEGGTISTPGL